jgi:beta-lactamase regulating signal transducer with metallopeptidase domain
VDVILNWVWQGGSVAIAAAAALRALPQSRPRARYGLLWAACVLVLLLPVVPSITAAALPMPLGVATSSPASLLTVPVGWWMSDALAVGLWIAWASIHAVRLAGAAVAIHEARMQAPECPADLQARLRCWSRMRSTGRSTRVVLSAGIPSAAVFGCGSPVIALAPALLERLSDSDLDRVVIHEWAHVQRRDDIAQLCQGLVRVIAGWHPAVWWLERQLNLEREVACDEMAVAVTGSAKSYAACLAALAALPLGRRGSLPALAVGSSSGLRRRFERLLAPTAADLTRRRATAVSASVVGLATVALAVGNVRVVGPAAAALRLPARSETAGMPVAVVAPRLSATPAAAPAPGAAAMSRQSADNLAPVKRVIERSRKPDTAQPTSTPSTEIAAELQPLLTPLEVPSSLLLIPSMPRPPAVALTATRAAAAETVSLRAGKNVRAPWMAAADAGVAIGRGSQNAGVATAAFFSRFGRKIAGSF